MLGTGTGTVVIWQNLDRVLPASGAHGGWAKRRFEVLVEKTKRHFGDGVPQVLDRRERSAADLHQCQRRQGHAWDPFVATNRGDPTTVTQQFELESATGVGAVASFAATFFPAERTFSSLDAFENAAGPLNWNRQQGLYVYRENRLVQWGSWGALAVSTSTRSWPAPSLDFD